MDGISTSQASTVPANQQSDATLRNDEILLDLESSKNNRSSVSSIQEGYLMHAFHSTRLSEKLTYSDASRSPDFWKNVQTIMSQRGFDNPASLWIYCWQRMQSALLKRIDIALRLQRTDSSWLTPLNKRMLTVMLEILDEKQLAHVEMCMADDEVDRLIVCATIYQDCAGDRYVMQCHNCRQTFSEADKLMAHIGLYKVSENTAADLTSDDEPVVLVTPRSQPNEEIVSSDDEEEELTDVSRGVSIDANIPNVDPSAIAVRPDDEGTMMDLETAKNHDENTQMFGHLNGISSDMTFDEFVLQLKRSAAGVVSTTQTTAPNDVVSMPKELPSAIAVQSKKTFFFTDDEYNSDVSETFETVTNQDGSMLKIDGNSSEIRLRQIYKKSARASTNILDIDLTSMAYLPFPCTVAGCSMRFRNCRELNKHTMSIHNRKAYQCPICPSTSPSLYRLNAHISGHERRFQCDICKRFFATRDIIIAHMLKHQSTLNYKCKDCDQYFRYSAERSTHWQTVHNGGVSKPYICDQCGRAFRNMSQLLKHKILHGAERPFKCPLCDSAFRSKCYLRRHIQRLHTNEKPLKCRHEGCEEHFRNYDTRVRHEARVHGVS